MEKISINTTQYISKVKDQNIFLKQNVSQYPKIDPIMTISKKDGSFVIILKNDTSEVSFKVNYIDEITLEASSVIGWLTGVKQQYISSIQSAKNGESTEDILKLSLVENSIALLTYFINKENKGS